jgi:hypothetical protein
MPKPTNKNNNNNNTGDWSLTRGLRNYMLDKPDLKTTAYIHTQEGDFTEYLKIERASEYMGWGLGY